MTSEAEVLRADGLAGAAAGRRRRRSLRRFIVVWSSAIGAAVAALAGVAIVSSSRLEAMAERILVDARGLERAAAFEGMILAQRREDLIWHGTRDPAYRDRAREGLAEADGLVGSLRVTVTSDEERALVADVEARYAEFRAKADEAAHRDPSEVRPFTERLIDSLGRYRALNERQMETTAAASAALNRLVDRWSFLTLAVVPVAVAAGAWRLWTRIFRPTIGLSRAAAAFGAGDLAARAPIERDDEMGDLARTFNAMAGEIENRERERLHFVAAVAHDLRNPLSVIGGTAHLLRRRGAAAAGRTEEWLDRILGQVNRLEAMTMDLTNAVQVQTGRLVLDREPVDLGALVREVAEGIGRASGRAIRLAGLGDDADRMTIVGDRRRLERVVENVVSNAVKYSAPPAEVEVGLAARDGRVVVAVEDRGVGIAPDDLANLFKPFVRAGRTARGTGGIGLGLFSAKRIVEAHGGTIEVRSRLGEGTTVEIALPAAAGADVGATSRSPSGRSATGAPAA